LQGEVLESQTAYWEKELAGAPFILELPTEQAASCDAKLPWSDGDISDTAKLLEQLKMLGREQQATLFMILESGFMALLHRYTGQEDIIVGTPISGRTRSEPKT